VKRSLVEIFESAIDDGHGQVDAGYLAIAVALVIILGAIPWMCVGALLQLAFSSDHHFAGQELGIGIGSVCGGFAAVCGAVGVFRAGDKDRAAAPKAAA
jgi:phosphate/sulfate permease